MAPPPKTEAQIRAEIQKEIDDKRAEEERKREEAESKRTMMASIGEFLGSGFGTIVGLIIFALLAYTIGQTKWGQELIETGISYLPEDWQVKAHGLLDMVGINTDMGPSLLAMADKDMPGLRKLMLDRKMPADVVTVITRDKATFAAFLDTVQKANPGDDGQPGKVNPSTMMNDKTIFALMTKQPVLVQLLAEAALKPGAGNSSTAKSVTEALRSIVASDRLDILLSGDNRANTLALIKRVAQASNAPVTDEMLTKVLQVGLDATGKATPNFRTFLTEALSYNDKGELQISAALENYATKEPAIKKIINDAIVRGPAPSAAPAAGAAAPAAGAAATTPPPAAAGESAVLTAIKSVPQNQKALEVLQTSLGDDKFFDMLKLAKGDNPLGMMKFALENRTAFDAFLKAADVPKLPDAVKMPLLQLSAIPAKAEKPIIAILNKKIDPRVLQSIFVEKNGATDKLNTSHLVTQLLDENNRQLVKAAGPKEVAELLKAYDPKAPAALNGNNIAAVLNAAQAIGDNPKMADATVRRDTIRVTTAFADMLMSGNPTALQKVPNEFANFMADPDNTAALKQLVKSTAGLPPKQQAMAGVFAEHFDLIERLAADKEKGMPFLLEALERAANSTPDPDACKHPNKLGFKADSWITWRGTDITGDNIIGKNAPEIRKLLTKLQVADCSDGSVPPPTPAGRDPLGQWR